MPDPLSVAAGIVGLVVPALHGARLLLDDIHQIRGAPKAVISLKDELRLFEVALKSLQAVEQSEWQSLGSTIADQAQLALTSCSTACTLFRDDLHHWTKHSDEGALSWRDRVNVGFFKQHRVQALSDQLRNCYKTINFVVSIATFYSSIRQGHTTEKIKEAVLENRAGIKDAVAVADEDLAEVQATLEQLRLSGAEAAQQVEPPVQDGQPVQERQLDENTVKQLEGERIALQATRKILQELLPKTEEKAINEAESKPQQVVQVTFNDIHLPAEWSATPPKPASTVPFPRDADFVHRGTLLEEIHRKCSDRGTWTALVGLGGVGKSQLAIEFAYRTQEQSPEKWVFWVHASNASRFEQSYRDMADCLKLPGRHDSKANIFKLVHDWLRHEGKIEWLLILDNVDDARFLVDVQSNSQNQTHESKPLREYLPQCPNGSVLITSRNAEAALTLVEQKDIIDVKPMDRDDALALLQKKLVALSTSQGDFEDATELVTVLEFMPLAIVQAAAYISQRAPRCSVRRYLEEFEKNDRKKSGLLNHEAGQLRRDREAKNSIIITWQMSFDHIHQTRPSAADLLSLMSFFDRQGIPETLLRSEPKLDKMDKRESGDAGGGAHDEDSSSQSSDGDEFEDDIMTLRNYSFISLNADGLAFKMHRLVQISMQKWLESTCQLERFRERFVKNLDAIFPVVTYETWDQCQTLYPHTKLALLQQPEDRPSLLNWASMLCKAAYYAQERGNWEDAEIMSLKTMKVLKEQLGEEDQHTLHTTWLVGLTYYHIGRWNEAEEVLARGLQICSRVLGEEHHLTLAVKAELARTYRDLGQWVKAESLQLQILEAYSQALGEKHPYTLSGMSNLASTYWFQGRWKEAEVLQLRVLETSSIILGERHPNTLFCMSDLATTYMELLQWEKAEVLLLQVLERSREVLGDEHPRTITNIQNLALTYAHRGKSREAEELQAQQLDTWSRVMGELHPNTLRVMRNVATAKWENGQQMEGLKSLQECSRLMRQVLGDNHFETINILARLARWEEHLGV